MPAPDIEPILARIDHADTHADRVVALTDEYLQSSAAHVVRRLDRASSRFIYSVASAPPFGEMSLVFGDAVHGYRAALDNLIWAAVSANGRNPGRSAQFPVVKEKKPETPKSIANRTRGVTAAQKAIIEEAQPYHWDRHHDDHLLAVLNDASNADKHHLTPPAVAANALYKGDRDKGEISRYYSTRDIPEALEGQQTKPLHMSMPVPYANVDCQYTSFGFVKDTSADLFYVELQNVGLFPDIRLVAPLRPTVDFGDPARSFDAERLREVSSYVRTLVIAVAAAA